MSSLTGILDVEWPWTTSKAGSSGLIRPDSALWGAIVARIPHDFYQLPAYAELCAKLDHGQACAYAELDDDFAFLSPLILLSIEQAPTLLHATCPYGYPGPIATEGASPERVAAAFERMSQALAARKVITFFSRLHPLLPLQLPTPSSNMALVSHSQTVSIDLQISPQESWAAMRSTHRRHITRERRREHKVHFSWDRLPEYQRCYEETMHRVGAADRYYLGPDYAEMLREVLGSSLHLITLEVEGTIACGGLFVETDGIIQYHLGGTRNDYLNHSPAKLLFDAVRIWGHERGARVLHLGGGVGAQGDSLFAFKAGFSERRHDFRTLRASTDPEAYEGLCSQLGVPAELSGYFPPFQLSSYPAPVRSPKPTEFDRGSERRLWNRYRAVPGIEF